MTPNAGGWCDPLTKRLFEALHGFRLVDPRMVDWHGNFEVRTGWYDNGRGAANLYHENGVKGCGVTVNLVEHLCGPDQFFIKRRRDWPDHLDCFLASGLFHTHEGDVSSGFIDNYGQLWSFTKDAHGTYRVLDQAFMQSLSNAYEAQIAEQKARQVERMLRPGSIGLLPVMNKVTGTYGFPPVPPYSEDEG